MANAVTRYADKDVTTTIKEADGVTLELSKDEAEVVLALAGNVGSGGDNRRLTSAVYYALLGAGVSRSHTTGRVLDHVVHFIGDGE